MMLTNVPKHWSANSLMVTTWKILVELEGSSIYWKLVQAKFLVSEKYLEEASKDEYSRIVSMVA